MASVMLIGCAQTQTQTRVVYKVKPGKSRACSVFKSIPPSDSAGADTRVGVAGHNAAGSKYCGKGWRKRRPSS